LTNEQLKVLQLQKQQGKLDKGRLVALTDIVADVKGAFECFSHATPVDEPFYYYDAINDVVHNDVEGPGYQILGVDILPAELPMESSEHFSNVLGPYVKELILNNNAEAATTLKNATLAENGKLDKKHEHLYELLGRNGPSVSTTGIKPQKNVLLLGSGLVAKPLVERLLKRTDVQMTIGKYTACAHL
jgi:alpha-aminoadipic semialdehyde synthase